MSEDAKRRRAASLMLDGMMKSASEEEVESELESYGVSASQIRSDFARIVARHAESSREKAAWRDPDEISSIRATPSYGLTRDSGANAKRFHQQLSWKARQLTSNEDLIEEAVQETLLHYWARLQNGEPITSPWAYLVTILTHVLAQKGKRVHASKLVHDKDRSPGHQQDPESNPRLRERRDLLRRANAYLVGTLIPRLRPEEQAPFVRCELQGEPIRAAASKLGMTSSTLQRRLLGIRAVIERHLWAWWRRNAGSVPFHMLEILGLKSGDAKGLGDLMSYATFDDAPENQRPSPRLGVELGGRYRLEESLLCNAIAEVFRGRDLRTGAPVHVEVFHTHIAMEEHERESWIANSAFAGSIESPAHLRPLSTASGPWLHSVVPALPSRSYLEHIATSEWTTHSLLRQLIPVYEALHRGHALGIVHGDLHSGQIFWAPESAEAPLRLYGLGTRPYAGLARPWWYIPAQRSLRPPELKDSRQPSDQASDVWSAVMVLYEAVMWKAKGSVEMLLQANDSVKLPSIRKLDGSIPKDVAFWLDAALHPDPARRPDMEHLLYGLRNAPETAKSSGT